MATTSPDVDINSAIGFLKTLFGPSAPGFIGLWTLQTKSSYWYKADHPDECARGVARFAPDSDLYVHLGLQARPTKPRDRGQSGGVVAVPGLWLDLDYADAVHKKPNLPPDRRAALAFLAELPFAPTLVIHSGHGLQAYWLWRELWIFDNKQEHDRAADIGRRWTRYCRDVARGHGWDVDSTHDLARIFRIPGTLNHKAKDGPPIVVTTVAEDLDQRYNPSDFDEFLPAYELAGNENGSAPVGEFIVDSGNAPPFEKFAAAMAATKFRKSWTRSRDDLQDQSGSGYDQSLANMAHMMGWSSQETIDLLIGAARKHGGEIKSRSYYEHTLAVAGHTEIITQPEIPPLAAGHGVDDFAPPAPVHGQATPKQHWQDGAAFLLDAAASITAIWGAEEDILMAEGESLLIVGPQGVGKSTIGQQLTLGFLGLRSELLGYPILPSVKNVLYLALDRPEQIRRSFQRMVTSVDREILQQRLRVWPGPLYFNALEDPQQMVDFMDSIDCDTLIVDSLKDLALGLTKDEIGSQINRLFQLLLSRGFRVVPLHHQRKSQAENKKPTKIDDVYGSFQITAGSGSVILLWGQPGDLIVEFLHLKQPQQEVGPFRIFHDHTAGVSTVEGQIDVLSLLRANHLGLVAEGVARALTGSEKATDAQVEKARRKLDWLVKKGVAWASSEESSTRGGRPTKRYFATTDTPDEQPREQPRVENDQTRLRPREPRVDSENEPRSNHANHAPNHVQARSVRPPDGVVGDPSECSDCENNPFTYEAETGRPLCEAHAPKDSAWWTE